MMSRSNAFRYFLGQRPRATVLVIVLLFISGLFEAIGVAAFLPFLQLFIDGKDQIERLPVPFLDDLIKQWGITLNFETIAIFIVTALSAKALILWLAMCRVSSIVADIAHDFRYGYLQSMIYAKWPFLASQALGENLNAVSTETFRASQTFVSATRLIAALIQVLIYTLSALILSWQTYVGIIITGCCIITILWVFVKISRKAGAQQTAVTKSLMRQISDIMRAIKPLRAMKLERFYLDKLCAESHLLKAAHYRQMFSSQSLRIFHEPLLAIGAVIGIYVAINFGALQGSALLVTMVFFMRIMTGLNQAQSEYQRLAKEQSALSSLIKITDFAKDQAEISKGDTTCPTMISSLLLKDVTFLHGESKILNNMTIDFQQKGLTILMGESGSGKTTILDLLTRFIEPHRGGIIVNDINLNEISLGSWRKHIGFVPQDVFLFNDTVRQNIVMGRSGFTDDNIYRALENAGAYDFVKALDDGLDYVVGENGQRLSGGQKQRLAIARAIIHAPSILILDEPTSALDNKTEQALFQTFKDISKNMIVIMASHNQDLKQYADQCITLKRSCEISEDQV